MSKDITGSSEGARITIIGDRYLPKSDRNFNPDAFARCPVFCLKLFRKCRRRHPDGPAVNNWDIAVSKRVPLWSEARFLQFPTEDV